MDAELHLRAWRHRTRELRRAVVPVPKRGGRGWLPAVRFGGTAANGWRKTYRASHTLHHARAPSRTEFSSNQHFIRSLYLKNALPDHTTVASAHGEMKLSTALLCFCAVLVASNPVFGEGLSLEHLTGGWDRSARLRRCSCRGSVVDEE